MGKLDSGKNWTPNRPIRPAQPPAQSAPLIAPTPLSTVAQVKIRKTHTTEELVEVTLPYYFEYDCGGDDYESMYYGKIEATRTTEICLGSSGRSSEVSVEIKVENGPPEVASCYMVDKYRSTEAAYLKAKARLAELLDGA